MKKLAWRVASVTDKGLHRKENQDNFYISPDERVFCVADGMGGVKGGAEASRIAVQTIDTLWNESRPHESDKQKIERWLEDAVTRANNNICDAADRINDPSRMGTTIVVAVQSDSNKLHIGHVGDSRAYLWKEGTASTITDDHSVVMEMVRNKRLTLEQARTNVFRHLLTRCLGHERDVKVDTTEVELNCDEWVLLCSDGLSSYVTDEEIGKSISGDNSAEKVCEILLSKTLAADAPDNVTIVAIRYQSATDSDPVTDTKTKAVDPGAKCGSG